MLLRCALQYLIREKVRTLLVVLGLASAFGAATFMYGAAGQVAHEATRSLRWVINDADLWLVPPSGLHLDPVTGAIVCDSRLPDTEMGLVASIDSDSTIRAFRVSKLDEPQIGSLVVYLRLEPGRARSAVCSPDVWALHERKAFAVKVDGRELNVTGEDNSLPPRVIAGFVPELTGPPSWLTIKTKNPGTWIRPRSVPPYIIRDTPAFNAIASDSRPVLYPITTSAGRFNAFSFDARFDALIMNSRLKSALGLFARLVLAFGSIVAVTSSLFGLREKSALIAVLTAHGITSEMIGILLAESGMLIIVSWMLGTALAVAVLTLVAFPNSEVAALMEGIAITTVFIPSLVLGATLVAVARLLSIPPARLVKGAFA